MAPRTYVVTGSASGMGKATKDRLEREGTRVIGVDLYDADVVADLSTPVGRATMVEEVTAIAGDSLDGVVSCAGVSVSGATAETQARIDHARSDMMIRINYFGAVATLDGLRPLLANGTQPRASVIASCALIRASRHDLIVKACLDGNESDACEFASQSTAGSAYACSKRAIACWVRQQAPTAAWAGAGIPINAIAPGLVRTVMTDSLLETGLGHILVPMPLHGPATAEQAASVLCWLTGPDNEIVTGQVIFFDGGFDALTRGPDIW